MIRFVYPLLMIFLVTCTNPFTTRDPEPPDENANTSNFEEARTPEQLLLNFEKAIEEKNLIEYIHCFADPGFGHEKTYRFKPEINLIDYFFNPWTKKDEENYFIKITEEERSDYPLLSFSVLDNVSYPPINLGAPEDSVETTTFRYQFSVSHIDTIQVYTGQMKLRFFRTKLTDSNWYIYLWTDYALNDQFEKSWSYLKYENR